MRRGQRWRVLLGLVLSLASVAGCSSASAPDRPDPGPLRILLVNDDGWNAPGIVTLRETLRRAGHRVVEVAPATRRDDDGMSATMTGRLLARKPTRDPDVWSVAGSPADAALFGMRAVMGRETPHLVIAGINPGPSLGLSTLQSGTVGSAMTAASNSIPAISVSADVPDPARPRPEDFRRAADFVTRLVARLQEQRTSLLLMPTRTVLNVNYPGGPQPARDVTVAPTSPVPAFSMIYRRGAVPGTYTPVPLDREQPGGDNDATALRNGDVVLTDLSSDPDRSAPPPRVAARLAPTLTP